MELNDQERELRDLDPGSALQMFLSGHITEGELNNLLAEWDASEADFDED